MNECYYVPQELHHQVVQQIPDAIPLDLSRPIDDQLYNFADRIKNTIPRTILEKSTPMEEVERINNKVISAHKRLQITLATREASWPLWLKNSLHNYDTIVNRGTRVETSVWPHANKPALIMGNGGSLKKNTEPILATRESYAIFANWHGLSGLIDSGIQPDAVTHIDKLSPNGLKAVSLPTEIPLILAPTTHAGFVQAFPQNPVYYLLTRENEAHLQWAEFLGQEPHKPAFGTVITSMIRAALYLGHRQIILAGVDLCFPDEAALKAYGLKPDLAIESTNQDGNPCVTVQNFLIYREVLETLAKEESQSASFHNASDGGLAIAGYDYWHWD